MKIYNIYHPIDGKLNTECKHYAYMYECIGSVEAKHINDAFRLAQNDFNEEYASLNRRSTSVGDIITDGNGHYMVKSLGFASCDPRLLQYVCPTVKVSRLNTLIQNNQEEYMSI
jgi:hypothetical protein